MTTKYTKSSENKNREGIKAGQNSFIIWIVLLFVVVGIASIGAVRHIFQLNEGLYQTAYDVMEQTVNQMSLTVTSTREADASNVVELASILGKIEDKDSAIKDAELSSAAYRYLYVEDMQQEGVASDGTSLKRDDTHDFTYFLDDDSIEVSEAFLSKSGNWCYLFRCPVMTDGKRVGWIYAQYLFDRADSVLPESMYDGEANSFILDIKSGKIVYQMDESKYESIVGYTIEEFFGGVLGTEPEDIEATNAAVKEYDTFFLREKMSVIPTLIYMTPMKDDDYYMIVVADERVVLKEANYFSVMVCYIIILSIFIAVILVVIFYVTVIRERSKRKLSIEREEHNKQLQVLVDEAIAANEAKSQFLANMSHEIRTPINAVIGMNEMILRECKQPQIESYATDVDVAAHNLLQIVNDILDFTKIESGKMVIINKPYELEKMVMDLFTVVKIKAQDKRLTISVDLDRNLPCKLMGDDLRIRQILLNLMTNAVKYTQEGGVSVKVGGVKRDEKVELTFSVEDTGIGIKEEDLPKLTEKFQRIEESRNRNIEGTGLGMNIASELLELMGSKMEVSSVYGKGSKFSFTLIQDIVDETPICKFTETKKDEDKHKASFIAPDANILVVDDNKMNCRIVVGLLKNTQIKVESALSGTECLDIVKKQKFDLIFLDHMMPNMDGVETLSRLKWSGDLGDTPVIALTANAVAGAREQYIIDGFSDYMTKPVDYHALEDMIIKYIPSDKVIMQ